MGMSMNAAVFLMESRIAAAAEGDANALYDLGVAYSTGAGVDDIDLVEAHKWFNLAALNGNSLAQESRAELADYMSAREIAEAQRQARAWLAASAPSHALRYAA